MKRLEKSKENMAAACYLNDSSLYAPSVHASYYGCFLLMKYIGNYKLSLPYEIQDDPEKGNVSHDSVFETIFKNSDAKIKKILRSKFQVLCRNRVEADYTDVETNKLIADNSILLAEEIRTNLSNFFNITI